MYRGDPLFSHSAKSKHKQEISPSHLIVFRAMKKKCNATRAVYGEYEKTPNECELQCMDKQNSC